MLRFSGVAVLIVCGTALTACLPPQRTADEQVATAQKKSPANAIYVYNGDGDARVGQLFRGAKWQIPVIADISFTACMDGNWKAAAKRADKSSRSRKSGS